MILTAPEDNLQVWPYWAYTYSPDPFQPKALPDEQNWGGELSRCPGFEDDPEHYECRPQPQGWSNCWKCPPKDPTGGGYTAYREVQCPLPFWLAVWAALRVKSLACMVLSHLQGCGLLFVSAQYSVTDSPPVIHPEDLSFQLQKWL